MSNRFLTLWLLALSLWTLARILGLDAADTRLTHILTASFQSQGERLSLLAQQVEAHPTDFHPTRTTYEAMQQHLREVPPCR